MISIVIAYGIAAMLASGTSNAYIKRAIERFGAIETAALRALISASVLFALLLVFPQPLDFSLSNFGIAFLIALTGYIPFMFFVRALEKGKVGIVVPVSSGWIVVASVFGILFLGEVMTPVKMLIVGLIVLGILMASLKISDFQKSSIASLEEGIALAVLSALIWGIVFPLFKIGAELVGGLFFAFFIEFVVSISAFIHLMLLKQSIPNVFMKLREDTLAFRALIIAGVLTSLFTLAMSLGYQLGEISVLSALGGSGILVSVIVAALLYGERLTKSQYAGAGLVLLGVLLTAII